MEVGGRLIRISDDSSLCDPDSVPLSVLSPVVRMEDLLTLGGAWVMLNFRREDGEASCLWAREVGGGAGSGRGVVWVKYPRELRCVTMVLPF